MELGDGLEHMGWKNRASYKLHIKGKHLARAFPEDIMSGCRWVAISFTLVRNLQRPDQRPIRYSVNNQRKTGR
jgi:hypothetical protein